MPPEPVLVIANSLSTMSGNQLVIFSGGITTVLLALILTVLAVNTLVGH